MRNSIKFLLIFLLLFLLNHSSVAQNTKIQIVTELGNIDLELFCEEAPITTKNFLQYIDENRLDSIYFYRIVRNDNQEKSPIKIQVIQAGLYEDDHPKMRPPISHESTKETGIKHLKGTISMARYQPGTATSEFFICLEDEPELDYGGIRNSDGAGFAAFGIVTKGMDIAKFIHQSPAEGQNLKPQILIYSIRRMP
ncbi:MAG: peptidylprolyl isomerase [Bacteroidetes bacterium 4572_77]|nr:MAG: peptidylprolyl isomerase [Bacteroidetes bacterium 4572_77]